MHILINYNSRSNDMELASVTSVKQNYEVQIILFFLLSLFFSFFFFFPRFLAQARVPRERQFQALRKTVVRKVKGGEAIMIIVSRRSDHRVREVKKRCARDAAGYRYPPLLLIGRRIEWNLWNRGLDFYIRYSIIGEKLIDVNDVADNGISNRQIPRLIWLELGTREATLITTTTLLLLIVRLTDVYTVARANRLNRNSSEFQPFSKMPFQSSILFSSFFFFRKSIGWRGIKRSTRYLCKSNLRFLLADQSISGIA